MALSPSWCMCVCVPLGGRIRYGGIFMKQHSSTRRSTSEAMVNLCKSLQGLLAAIKAAPDDIDVTDVTAALALLEDLSAALRNAIASQNDGARILSHLPPELIVQVLCKLPPASLAASALVCRCFGLHAKPRPPHHESSFVEQALRLQESERTPLVPLNNTSICSGRITKQQSLHEPALVWPPWPGASMSKLSAQELLCDAVRHQFSGASLVLGAGRAHSVFLNADGLVLTSGGNRAVRLTDQEVSDEDDEDERLDMAAALGHAGRSSVERPTIVSHPLSAEWRTEPSKRFVGVAVGPKSTLAISDLGEVYSCGGQSREGDVLRCIRIRPHDGALADPIVSVACGMHHCMALSERGVVRTWGKGIEGALGHGTHGGVAEYAPKVVEGLTTVRIVSIAAGLHHSLALSATGVVFSWGEASKGALGLGDESEANLHSPYPVTKLLECCYHERARVCAISAGGSHSVALTHQGTLYSWGTNFNGQLGRDTSTEGTTGYLPGRVVAPVDFGEHAGAEPSGTSIPAPVRFHAIACGAAHSVALSAEAGCVYAWGSSVAGCLGVDLDRLMLPKAPPRGAADTQRWWRRRHGNVDVLAPMRVDDLRGIVHISAGWCHTLAATRDGQVYGWGDLHDHCLGLPHAVPRSIGSRHAGAEPTKYEREVVNVKTTAHEWVGD